MSFHLHLRIFSIDRKYRYNSILSGLIEYLIDLIDFYLLKMEILKYLEIKISYVTNIVNEKNHRIIIPLIFHSTWNYFLRSKIIKDSNLVRQLATRLIPSLLHLSEGKPESVQAYVQRLEQE